MKSINELVQLAHEDAVRHGWWGIEPPTFGDLLSLVHSELSEVLEEHRNHKDPTETYYSGKNTLKKDCNSQIVLEAQTTEKDSYMIYNGVHILCSKPEGTPAELADVVIRVFDICGYYGIDLQAAIEEKMDYNKTRPYKHGGKKL